MSNEIGCDVCSKEATVHLTQIINGKVHKVDLCEDCAQNLGVTDPNGFSVADLLSKDLIKGFGGDTPEPEPRGSCPTCGCTPQQFKQSGRLGCPDCYDAFSGMVGPLLKNMHSGVEHVGKVPHHTLKRQEHRDSIEKLEAELQAAVEREDYEEAAHLRDSIADIKADTPAEKHAD